MAAVAASDAGPRRPQHLRLRRHHRRAALGVLLRAMDLRPQAHPGRAQPAGGRPSGAPRAVGAAAAGSGARNACQRHAPLPGPELARLRLETRARVRSGGRPAGAWRPHACGTTPAPARPGPVSPSPLAGTVGPARLPSPGTRCRRHHTRRGPVVSPWFASSAFGRPGLGRWAVPRPRRGRKSSIVLRLLLGGSCGTLARPRR